MKTSKKIGIATKAVLCTLGGLLLLAIFAVVITLPWSVFVLQQLFSPAPKKPVAEYGEFPFEVVYQFNGEQTTITDTLVVEFLDSYTDAYGDPHYEWNSYLKSGKEFEKKYMNSIAILDGIIDGQPISILYCLGSSAYYMGTTTNGSGGEFVLSDGETVDQTTLYEKYGVWIISTKLSVPLGQEPVSDFEYSETASSVEITGCTDPLNTTIKIPSLINGKTVTALGNCSFYQTEHMHKVLLPDTLRVIDDNAFYRCYNLQSIEIPKKVRYIGSNPFFRCSSLQSITVQSDSEFFTAQDGILYNKNMTILMAYPEGKTEEIYYLPESVTKLNSAAFGYHPQLKEIHLHENVTDGLDSMITAFPEEITFYVKSGSAAEIFVKEHTNIQYKIEE